MSDDPLISEDDYRRNLENHEAWHDQAVCLHRAADLIWTAHVATGFVEMNRVLDLIKHQRTSGEFAATLLKVALPLGNMYGVYLLNAGYAIEAILKAVRVRRLLKEGKTVAFGEGPDLLPKTHAYLRFAETEIGGVFSNNERYLLRQMSAGAQWAGRYPVPLKRLPSGTYHEPRGAFSQGKEIVDGLFERMTSLYVSM